MIRSSISTTGFICGILPVPPSRWCGSPGMERLLMRRNTASVCRQNRNGAMPLPWTVDNMKPHQPWRLLPIHNRKTRTCTQSIWETKRAGQWGLAVKLHLPWAIIDHHRQMITSNGSFEPNRLPPTPPRVEKQKMPPIQVLLSARIKRPISDTRGKGFRMWGSAVY